ncbi:hypothetical protein IXW71_07530 [Escherichia coli]
MKNTFNKIYKKESPESLLRTHCISVRLNHEELQLLNARRGDKSKGEWFRLVDWPPESPDNQYHLNK